MEDCFGVGLFFWRDEDDVLNFFFVVFSSYMCFKGIVRFFGNKIDVRNLVEVGFYGWYVLSIVFYDFGDIGDMVIVDRVGWYEKEK